MSLPANWQKQVQAALAKQHAGKKKADTTKADAVAKKQKEVDALDDSSVSNRIKKQAGGDPSARQSDIAEGAEFGEAVLGKDGLGRMGADEGVAGMEAQAKELAKGFSSEESLARQEKGMEGIQGSVSSQSRAAQAAMARSGVKGQAAGAQLGNIAMSGVQARGNLERDLVIGNRQAQLQGLQAQAGVTEQRLGQERFDIGQAAKEKDIALQAGLGFAQMGVTERSADKANLSAVKAAKAGKQKSCFLQGTEIRMMDNSIKKIEDIKLADFVKEGDVVYSISQGLVSEIYEYNDIMVATGHAVLDNGTWKRVEDAKGAIKHEGIFPVYNMGNECHRIVTANGTVFADFDETDYASKINDNESLEVLNGFGDKVLERRRRI